MNERLHIAHFTNTYHPSINGVVRSVSVFRQALTDLGHNIFIFAPYASHFEDTDPLILRYPAIELPISPPYAFPIPVSPFVDRLLPSLKLDVIHSHHPFLLGQAAARKANQLDLPLVFTFHTRYDEYSHYVPLNQTFVKGAITEWLRDYLQHCQHIIAPSNSIKQMFTDHGVIDRVTTIPTGIDLAPFRAADGQALREERGWGKDKVLISVGRLAVEKNWPTLLAAAGQVMRQHREVRLVIIGEGEEHNALLHQAQELGIADRVDFTGLVPFADIPRYLKAADLFCFASVTETQGLVTMEAMAASLPVVAVNANGTRDEVEHGQEGLLTDNDSAALAQAIHQVVEDETLWQQFRQAAGKKAESFDIRFQAEKLVNVYHQAMEDKKAKLAVQVEPPDL